MRETRNEAEKIIEALYATGHRPSGGDDGREEFSDAPTEAKEKKIEEKNLAMHRLRQSGGDDGREEFSDAPTAAKVLPILPTKLNVFY